MKTFSVILAVALASSLSAMGKAYFFSRPELIENSDVIAIVTLEEPEVAKPVGDQSDPFAAAPTAAGERFTYAKQAKVHVEQVLKGKIANDFILYGEESFIYAQTTLSKGRFIAFLKKDGDLWVGANWMLSLRPIKDKEGEWFVSDEERYPQKFQSLDEVVAAIKAALARPQSGLGADGKVPAEQK